MTLSSGCRLLRPQMAGTLERVDGVRVTSFWRTVKDCLLRAPFSYGLAIADSALRAKAYRATTSANGSRPIARADAGIAELR